jgi:hypothetical protein
VENQTQSHRRQRMNGCSLAQTVCGTVLKTTVKGDRDPGYGSTCNLIAESVLCLISQDCLPSIPGGV